MNRGIAIDRSGGPGAIDRIADHADPSPDAMFEALLGAVSHRGSDADPAALEHAFSVARQAHAEQTRKSGEPYLVHPVRVAHTIARLGLDSASVIAGLLHDAVEDSELSVYELTEQFGREVAVLVDGVTKLGKVPYLSRKEQQAESFRKMLVAMSSDIRVLLVKLADRLDNMRTLQHMPSDKQERISRETMEIYAPLAHRLGIEWLRRELQDLSFRYLEPATYRSIEQQAARLLQQTPEFLERTLVTLKQCFSSESRVQAPDPDAEVEGLWWDEQRFGPVEIRATLRSPYQLHMMCLETGRRLDQVSDLATYQVVPADRAACYAALGLLHGHFKPVPGRFRDYVALPRPNGYRALHTSVVDREGVRMEIQVRSRQMDDIARRGIIARFEAQQPGELWRLRGRGLAWLGQLMDWQGEVRDPSEFIEAVKADLFADEVYVFTPQGDIHTFPKDATPIDFAFAIHTDVGMRCSGARVNGQVVPLRYRLRQGDTVEIITNPDYGPRPEWMKICVTSRARAKIKHYLRAQERARLRALGRSLLEQELSSRGVSLDEYEERGVVAEQTEALGLGKESRGGDAVYEAVGSGRVSAWDVAEKLAPPAQSADSGTHRDRNLFARMLRKMAGKSRGTRKSGSELGRPGKPIMITQARVMSTGGEALIQLASCCAPVPGDPLVAFFKPGTGIVAHVQGCPEALEQLSDQRVQLKWGDDLELDCPVTLEVRTDNEVGLLAEMSRVFSYHDVNIKQAHCRAQDDGDQAVNTFHASVRNAAQLHSLTAALKGIEGVIGVRRVFRAHRGSDAA